MQACKAVERLADLRLLPDFDDIKVWLSTSAHVGIAYLLCVGCHSVTTYMLERCVAAL